MKAFFLLTAAIALSSCGQSFNRQHYLNVFNLPKAFDILEKYQVTAYRNQDWCKNIAYSRGRFTNETKSTCTYLLQGAAEPFDGQAHKDFKAIAREIAGSGVGLYSIEAIQYDTSGQLVMARFNLKGLFNRRAYVYAPGYKELPEDMPHELTYTALNQDWYYVWEDWN